MPSFSFKCLYQKACNLEISPFLILVSVCLYYASNRWFYKLKNIKTACLNQTHTLNHTSIHWSNHNKITANIQNARLCYKSQFNTRKKLREIQKSNNNSLSPNIKDVLTVLMSILRKKMRSSTHQKTFHTKQPH